MRSRAYKEAVSLFFVASLAALSFFPLSREVPMRGDENYWMHSTRYFRALVEGKGPQDKVWKDRLAFDQPPVGKYIFGAALYASGTLYSLGDLQEDAFWSYVEGRGEYAISHISPPLRALRASRFVSALSGILACLFLYLAVRLAVFRLAGVFSAAVFMLHPLSLWAVPVAMTDSFQAMFCLAGLVLCSLWYIFSSERRTKRTLLAATLCGLSVGLGMATKVSATVMVVAVVAFFCFAGMVRVYRGAKVTLRKAAFFLAGLLCFLTACAGTFVAVNPALYAHPRAGIIRVVKEREKEIAWQRNAYFRGEKPSLRARAGFLLRRVLTWDEATVFHNPAGIWLDLILFLLGTGWLVVREARHILLEGRCSLCSLLLVWAAVWGVALCVGLPLLWERYCFMFVPCAATMSGIAVAAAFSLVGRFPQQYNTLIKSNPEKR